MKFKVSNLVSVFSAPSISYAYTEQLFHWANSTKHSKKISTISHNSLIFGLGEKFYQTFSRVPWSWNFRKKKKKNHTFNF